MTKVKAPDPCSVEVDRLRVKRGLTWRQLADAAGMPLSTLHRIVHGGHTPRADHVRSLAAALKVRPDRLLAPKAA